MTSNGGVFGAEATTTRRPVYTALSGPAAGVMSAIDVSGNTGIEDSISFDMGGTSTDVSLVSRRTPTITLSGQNLEPGRFSYRCWTSPPSGPAAAASHG